MLIAFTLTMPGNNAWNGRWSGEGRLYAKVVNVGTSNKAREKYAPLLGKSFGYNFGDGWYANVAVSEPTAVEARRLRKQTQGFCGYDWMVDELRQHGRILTLAERTTKC